MPRTVPNTVKTNALKKKRVVMLIRKITLPLISLFSKLVTYTLIPVAIDIYLVGYKARADLEGGAPGARPP